MLEDGVQRRHCLGGHPFAAGRDTAPATNAGLRRLAGSDVGLGAFDVPELERANLPFAKQRSDMRVNPAAVHPQCGRPDRPPAPAEDAPGFGLGQIPVTNVVDRQLRGRLGLGLLFRVDTLGDHRQFLKGERASFFDRHQAVAADDGPLVAPGGRPVLDDEAFQTRRHHLDAEASELAIPHKTLPNLDPNSGRFRSSERVDNALCELFPSHINYLQAICLEVYPYTPFQSGIQASGGKSRDIWGY